MTYEPIWELKHLGENAVIYTPCLILKPEMVEIDHGARVDSFTKLEGGLGLIIGPYAHICSFAHINIGGGVLCIGYGVGIASGARILSGGNKYEALCMSCVVPPDEQAIERGKTVIERYACVLVNAVVLPNVTIHEGAVVGAGAVVTHDVPAWEIWAGVPARKIGVREVRQRR